MYRHCFLVALSAFGSLPLCVASASPAKGATLCSVFEQQARYDCQPVTESFVVEARDKGRMNADNSSVLSDAFNALAVLQNTYYDTINGTWPNSIDWTGAVIQTILAGTVSTLSKSLLSVERDYDWGQKERLISSLFSHVAHSFAGQNAVAILDEVRTRNLGLCCQCSC